MPSAIQRSSERKALTPRREPYWARIETGAYLGFRKLDDGTGTWVARWRDESGGQKYNSLGAQPDYDTAARKAREWFDQCKGGSTEVVDVAEACRRYVEDRRREKGEATAKDAEGRFKRHVYSTKFGRLALSALRTAHITDWRNALVDVADDDDDPDAERRAKDSANRDLATLKAALNLAYRMGLVGSTAQWDRVKSFEKVGKRRERFLTVAERKRLITAATPELQRLIKGLLLTAVRPGELAGCKVGDLDSAGLLTVEGKTGRRTIPVSPDALAHLKACAGKRDLSAPLVARDDGQAWTRFYWRDAMQAARTSAGLPDDVVLYNLRHVAISEMIVSGMDPLTVARIAGTSVAMIQRHYGHLIKDKVIAQLAKVKML